MEYQTYAQAGKGKPQDCARAGLRSKTGVISGGMLSQVVSLMWAWRGLTPPDSTLLRPVLLELKRRYHEPEPGKPPNFTPRHDAPR